MNTHPITHDDLVQIAYRWVLTARSCGVAFREFNSAACNGEYPDVIGFGAWGHSVVVECKISRSDFARDKLKSFRKSPEQGMGSQRFFCCPTGLVHPDELPEGWGLVYVSETRKARIAHDPYGGNVRWRKTPMEKNIKAEHGLMYSALRRLHLRGLLDTIYENRGRGNEQFLHTPAMGAGLISALIAAGFREPQIIGSVAAGVRSLHDLDVLLPHDSMTPETLVRLTDTLCPKDGYVETDWPGWFFHGTVYGEVDVFFGPYVEGHRELHMAGE